MREARLSGAQPRAPADDRRGRRAVVRRAEGRIAYERVLRIDQAGDGVDPRHLEGVLLLERRQDPGKAPREHRLAGSRRAAEEQVVPAGGRDLERAARAFLAADVREIERRPLRTAVAGHELRRLEIAA